MISTLETHFDEKRKKKKEKRKKMKSNKEHTSLFSLKDIPRIMSKAFLTKRFLIIRTFSTAKKQKLGWYDKTTVQPHQ
jgi:hypothetical protein